MAASGKREPNDVRSFLTGPGFRILLGIGTGYVAHRLRNRRQDLLDSKIAQLNAAPTIPISSLKSHKISGEGELVVIQNGIVYPLSSVPESKYKNNDHRLFSGGVEAVVSKTVTYTDQPKEFEKVFKGTRHVEIYKVPFALVAGRFSGRGCFVTVINADEDHLPLDHETTVATPLNPPVKLTKKVIIEEEKDENRTNPKTEHESSTTIEVKKVTKQSFLRTGTRLESVFGKLSTRNGTAAIEPCPDFPKKCFAMSRDEIKKLVCDEAKADVDPSKRCGFGLGLVSLGLLLSGFYSYSRT